MQDESAGQEIQKVNEKGKVGKMNNYIWTE